MSVTVESIIRAVRELTFDRFLVNSIIIKAWDGYVIDVSNGQVVITNGVNELRYILSDYPTNQDFIDRLLQDGVVFSYGPYYMPTEPPKFVNTREPVSLDTHFRMMRPYFYSDDFYLGLMTMYYNQVLFKREFYYSHPALTKIDITDELVGQLKYPNERHIALWVACKAVEHRRLQELANSSLSMVFSDGEVISEGTLVVGMGSTTVNIGDVFTMTEDPSGLFLSDDFNSIGSDNVLGDKSSFWFKLWLWLRSMLENEYGDFSFRNDNLIQGQLILERSTDFRNYFDSFPFSLSPYTRGLIADDFNSGK